MVSTPSPRSSGRGEVSLVCSGGTVLWDLVICTEAGGCFLLEEDPSCVACWGARLLAPLVFSSLRRFLRTLVDGVQLAQAASYVLLRGDSACMWFPRGPAHRAVLLVSFSLHSLLVIAQVQVQATVISPSLDVQGGCCRLCSRRRPACHLDMSNFAASASESSWL
jgi:hypothetical protein